MTRTGILKAAHLGGAGGVNKFLNSNVNATDVHGTSIADYMFGVK